MSFFEESEGRIRYLEPEEEARLLDAAPEPVRSMIVIGINCGLRLASEGLTLQWESVDLSRRRLTIVGAYSKNKRARVIPLNAFAYDALVTLKAKALGPYVFEKKDGSPYKSFRTTFEKACAAARLDDVGPHVLRHTFATRLIEKGADVRIVQDLGGWRSGKMVERYSHPSERGKIDAIKRLESFHVQIHTTPEPALVKTV